MEGTPLAFNMLMSRRHKHIERAFGVLRGKFQIAATPSKLRSKEDIVVLHNMIVDEKIPLISIKNECGIGSVNVGDTVDCCSERSGLGPSRVIRGTIASLCKTERHLNSAS